MLNLTHIELRYRAVSDVRLPENAGSAWRGAFGHALRRAVCITGQADCSECPVQSSCTYTEIFETRPPPGDSFLSRYSDAPHPYLIGSGSPVSLVAGESATLRMTLIGRSGRHAETVAGALSRAVARVDAQGELEPLGWEVRTEPFLPMAPMAPPAARIVLESPLRLRVQDHYWRPADFRFGPFFSTLLRRLTQLRTIHGEGEPDVDARSLVEIASQVDLRRIELRWQPLHRYSSRQKRKIPMGGLLGSFELGGQLSALWPWLWAGQFVHVGKGTVMGLGRYRIEPIAVDQMAPPVPRVDRKTGHATSCPVPIPQQGACSDPIPVSASDRKSITWLVTRHPGATEWMDRHGIAFDCHVRHLDPHAVRAGDVVIGTLPVQLAAEVCANGARYLNLSLDLPESLRGVELSALQLDACNGRVEEFRVTAER